MIKNNGNNSNKEINKVNGEINKVNGEINKVNDSMNKGIPKYIKKLSDKYTNKDVKEKMLLFRHIIIEKLEKQNELIDNIIDVSTKFQKVALGRFDEFGRRKIIDDLVNDTNKSDDELPSYFFDETPYMNKITELYKQLQYEKLESFSLLMDSYFMRRFCDKDYILNAISYTGGAHSMAYVNFLCNQFDFEITHVAKSSEPIDIINKKLKAKFDYIGFAKYFFPKTLSQCVDLSDFPKNFD
jgi:predicted metal-dependent hydrolase